MNNIIDNLKKYKKIKISNFGTFSIRSKRSRFGRNPKTKEKKIISERKVVLFKPETEVLPPPITSNVKYTIWSPPVLVTLNVVDESIPLLDLGETIYKKNACYTCHSTDGSTVIGPSFKGI